MTTYSQYDTTSSFVSSEIGTTYQLTWTCSGLSSDAVRYSAGSSRNIAFETSSNAPGNVHVWRDDGASFPAEFSNDNINWGSNCADAQTIYIRNIGGGSHSFSSPQWPYLNTGPTVTSITRNASTNLITVLHTGTLTSSDVNHTISNVSSSITNLQTITNGSTFTASSTNGTHVIQIGDEILTYFIYNDPNSRTIMTSNNNLVVTFPTTDNDWLSNFSAFDSETITNISYLSTKTHVSFAKNASRNYYVFVTFNLSYNSTQAGFSVLTQIYDYESSSASNNWAYSYSSTLQWVYPEATFESTGSADTLITLPTNDIVTSFNWNFASVNASVSTTSNGGGKPDRYPLIMTNLFNRNRSLYSIGMTHKDTWDLFL